MKAPGSQVYHWRDEDVVQSPATTIQADADLRSFQAGGNLTCRESCLVKGLFGKYKKVYWWDSQVRGEVIGGVGG